MKAKPEPTLADRLLAANPGTVLSPPNRGRHMVKTLQQRLRRAEKMVFDQAASRRVGEVLRDIPELIAENVEFARAPFDLTWIEYDGDAMWEAVTGRVSNKRDMTRDTTIGMLIDHSRVNVVSLSPNNKIGLMPIAYHLNTVWPLDDQVRLAEAFGVSRMQLDLWLWGTTATKLRLERPDLLRSLREIVMVELFSEVIPGWFYEKTAGDFKNVVALLLMLNQPRVTQYVRVPPRRGWIGANPKPLVTYNTVTVSLDAKARTIALSQGKTTGELRRGHRVRGHYCHNEEAHAYARIAGCIHDWIATRGPEDDWEPAPTMPLDEREHWVCSQCGGKRWWRHTYDTGGKGFVDHSRYNITH